MTWNARNQSGESSASLMAAELEMGNKFCRRWLFIDYNGLQTGRPQVSPVRP